MATIPCWKESTYDSGWSSGLPYWITVIATQQSYNPDNGVTTMRLALRVRSSNSWDLSISQPRAGVLAVNGVERARVESTLGTWDGDGGNYYLEIAAAIVTFTEASVTVYGYFDFGGIKITTGGSTTTLTAVEVSGTFSRDAIDKPTFTIGTPQVGTNNIVFPLSSNYEMRGGIYTVNGGSQVAFPDWVSPTANFNLTGLEQNTQYTLQAYINGVIYGVTQESAWQWSTATTAKILPTLSGLSVVAEIYSGVISYTATAPNSSLTSVEYSIGNQSNWVTSTSIGGQKFRVSGLAADTQHTIYVRSKNAYNNYSSVLSVSFRTLPAKPVLSITVTSSGMDWMELSITSDIDTDAAQYSIDNGTWTSLPLTVSTSRKFTALLQSSIFTPITPKAHNIRVRGRHTASQLWGDNLASSTWSFTPNSANRILSSSLDTDIGSTINFSKSGNSKHTRNYIQLKVNGNLIKSTDVLASAESGTMTLTEDEVIALYKYYPVNSNELAVTYELYSADQHSTYSYSMRAVVTVKGNVQTIYISDETEDKTPRKSKIYMEIHGVPVRAIAWIGDENKIPRRVIC